MEADNLTYLYQSGLAVDLVLLLGMACSLARPYLLAPLMTFLLLLRPNERFDCLVSYPRLILPLLALSLVFGAARERRARQLALDRPLLLFIGVIGVETLLFHGDDLLGNAEYILVGLLLYYAVLLIKEGDNLAPLSHAVVISCLLICGEALYYHLTETPGSPVWNIFHTRTAELEVGRLQAWGNWRNPNETAFLACLAVANISYLCINRGRTLYRAGAVVLIPFFAMVVFLTASRAGLASLLLIFVPMLLLFDSRAGKAAVLVALAAVLFLSALYSPARTDSQGSTEDRYDLRYKGVQLFKSYPVFGVGFQRARYNTGGQPLHNTYLQSLAETGVVGATCLFYYLYRVAGRLWRVVRNNRRRSRSNLEIVTVSGPFLSTLFYFMWGNQLLSLIFFLCMAQANAWIQVIEAREADAPSESGSYVTVAS